MMNIEDNLINTIKKFNLTKRNEKILVMVSGGPDSMALLHLLYKNVSKNLHVFHLNHKIRKEAVKDEIFVLEEAKKLNLKTTIISYDVMQFAKDRKLSLQDAARKIRYRLAEETAERLEIYKIAVAHQADDTVETFLYRIIKGSGPMGLKSIPVQRNNLIRPMLFINKNEILKYLKQKKINYIQDPSNKKTIYSRNKIRLELLPVIKEINPSFEKTVATMIDIISADDSKLTDITEDVYDKYKNTPDYFQINYNIFNKLELSIKRRLLRIAIKNVKTDLIGIEYRHIEDIINKSKTKSFRIDLPDSIVCYRDGSNLVVSQKSIIESVCYKPLNLPVPGKIYIKELDTTIETLLVKPKIYKKPDKAFVDIDKIKLPLTIKQWENGDKFIPYGMKSKKKLQDYFIDKKVPKRLKETIPIIEDCEKIIWLSGYTVDDRVKITNKTRKALEIKIIPGKP